jgi:hypothetical protein
MLIRYASQHVQHLQKVLEQMNVKLTEVVSDITGVTGLAIIQAIVRGQRDPLELAKLRHARCHRSEAEITRALYGNWREEHLFALRQALELYQTYQTKLRVCDDCIERHLQTFTDHSSGHQLEPQISPTMLRKRDGSSSGLLVLGHSFAKREGSSSGLLVLGRSIW